MVTLSYTVVHTPVDKTSHILCEDTCRSDLRCWSLMTFSKWPNWRTSPLFYDKFITVLYMFRATSCSSSGG